MTASPYLRRLQRRTRSVEEAAKRYLHGLFQCDRSNMEQTAEQVRVATTSGFITC
ncbi:MAG: hypothetical protein IPP59_12355 [Betaproteobacteria bacterium]|nr:hypothetical protein [Candidatus Dechloromonas phosphorivorans]